MRLHIQSLSSNGFQLSSEPHRLGWLEATNPSLPIETLKKKYREHGYLWLKGFFAREEVLAMRRLFFASLVDTGLLADGSAPVEGNYSGKIISHEAYNHIYADFAKRPEYIAFCTGPRIWKFYEEFLGGEIHLHQRRIIRFNIPHDQNCTAGHYDLIYLRAGTDQVCTSWIPFGDAPVEMGGLTYLDGSDALGRKTEAEFTRKNADLPPAERISAFNKNMTLGGWITKDLPALADLHNSRWLIADYEAGDMVVHSSYMIHASTTNVDEQGRMRLSTDIRYQRRSDSIDQRWQKDFYVGDGL